MTKQQWIRRLSAVVLVCTLVAAVLVSAQAGTSAHITPLVTAEAGITTIYGLSPRSYQLLP